MPENFTWIDIAALIMLFTLFSAFIIPALSGKLMIMFTGETSKKKINWIKFFASAFIVGLVLTFLVIYYLN